MPTEDAEAGDLAVLLPSGVRSFHAATMLRTDVSGERGDVCGRRSDDAVGVPVKVFVLVVGVRVLLKVE